MNNLIDKARAIPVREAEVTVSISPVTLPAPERGRSLEMRITAPMRGSDLPIVLLSHGHGPSLYIPSKDGYGPLANFYAEQGFAVIQPTHANSKVAGFPADGPGAPLFWRQRVEEMKLILDHLDEIEVMVPAIAGRIDHTRIAAVGHSMGGQTVGMLLGARLTDPKDENARDVDLHDLRIKAGVLMSTAGSGKDLSPNGAKNYSALNPDFSRLLTKTLVAYGDADLDETQHLTVRGPDWFADSFHLSPGADALLTLFGGKHSLGGVPGYDAKEIQDEDPDRLAVVQRLSAAYLRSALDEGDPAWAEACSALADHAASVARVDLKQQQPPFREALS